LCRRSGALAANLKQIARIFFEEPHALANPLVDKLEGVADREHPRRRRLRLDREDHVLPVAIGVGEFCRIPLVADFCPDAQVRENRQNENDQADQGDDPPERWLHRVCFAVGGDEACAKRQSGGRL
jgi:hypothetical protein